MERETFNKSIFRHPCILIPPQDDAILYVYSYIVDGHDKWRYIWA